MHTYQSPDDLPDNLKRYVTYGKENNTIFDWFYHPFYVFFFPTMTPLPIEEMIELRKQSADKKLKNGEYGSYVFSHERAFRMDAFIKLIYAGTFSDGTMKTALEYWRLAADVWTDNENDESDICWSEIIFADVPYRGLMTLSEDRRFIRNLPERVTVYRGVTGNCIEEAHQNGLDGWQWTLDESVAVFFANRYPAAGFDPFILRMDIPKHKIVAYLTSRAEAEILIEPDTYDSSSVEIYPSPERK